MGLLAYFEIIAILFDRSIDQLINSACGAIEVEVFAIFPKQVDLKSLILIHRR
jgi:hypothetical protein